MKIRRCVRASRLVPFLLAAMVLATGNAMGAIQTVNEDASVWSGAPNSNGNFDTLYVGSSQGGAGVARSYLKFHLPVLAPNTAIATATLSGVYQTDWWVDDGFFDWHLAASDTWSENAITWNNQPGMIGAPIASWDATGAIPNQTYSWDITSAVNAAYQSDGVISLVFKSAVEGVGETWEYWWGKESATYPFTLDFTIGSTVDPGAVPEPFSMAVWGGIALMGAAVAYKRRVAG